MRCILRFLEELMAPLVVDIFFFFFSFYFFFFFLFFCLSYTDILEFLYPSQFTVLLRLFFFSLLAAFFDLLSTLWWRRVHIRRIKMIREFSRSNLIVESRSLRSKLTVFDFDDLLDRQKLLISV